MNNPEQHKILSPLESVKQDRLSELQEASIVIMYHAERMGVDLNLSSNENFLFDGDEAA